MKFNGCSLRWRTTGHGILVLIFIRKWPLGPQFYGFPSPHFCVRGSVGGILKRSLFREVRNHLMAPFRFQRTSVCFLFFYFLSLRNDLRFTSQTAEGRRQRSLTAAVIAKLKPTWNSFYIMAVYERWTNPVSRGIKLELTVIGPFATESDAFIRFLRIFTSLFE